MGYTHYWRKPNGVSRNWNNAIPIIQRILKKHRNIIQYELDDDADPVCNEHVIRFNGIGEDGHETFLFTNAEEEFAFCKTARKPYDIVVCECLIVLQHFMPELKISSDGMSGRVSDEVTGLTVGDLVQNLDGCWNEALANVSKEWGINYLAKCVEIDQERGYYRWELMEVGNHVENDTEKEQTNE